MSIADNSSRKRLQTRRTTMAETSITKVNAKSSPKGSMGQKYLAAGIGMAMRLWETNNQARKNPQASATMKRSAMSLKDGPSCTWVSNSCCWNRETHGWCRAAQITAIESWSRLPPWKRRTHRHSFTGATRRTANTETVPLHASVI